MEPIRRTVLITGCSSGIGRSTALYLAQQGWHVLATARRLDAILDLAGPHIDLLELDVANERSRVAAIEAALARAGRIDALVNNAGFSIGGPLERITLDEARWQFETNVWGALRMCQLVIPAMRAQGGGCIVNVTSVLGRLSFPFSGLYASSKYALEALSDNLRWELYPWNIRVALVEPGFVKTRFGANAQPFRARHENDPHYGEYLRRDQEVRAPVQRGSAPVAVAAVIERALTDPDPAPRYPAGLDAHAAFLARGLTPDRLYDFLIRTFFGLNRKQLLANGDAPRPAAARGVFALALGVIAGLVGLQILRSRKPS
ncbi:MAG: SDR family oxidoreductase [Anaerolineae bacterium]